MNRSRLALAAAIALSLVLLAAARPRAPWPEPGDVEHAALAPAGALAFVEFRDADGLLARGLEHPLAAALFEAGLAEAIEAQTGSSPAAALAALDERAGYAVLPAVAELAARGAALSVHLRGAKVAWLVTLQGDDAHTVERRLEQALDRAAELAGYAGALDAPAERRGTSELWRLGDELAIARSGAWVLASGDEGLLGEALERAGGDGGLARAPAFARARAARAADATLWGWSDLAKLRALQRLADGDKGLLELEQAVAQPAAQFLLGPALALLGSAESLALSLSVSGEDSRLVAQGFGVAAGPARALLPAQGGAATLVAGARDALHGRVYRDLRGLFAARGELFPPQAQPGFAEAESNLALFFGGRDVAEAVLPHLSPWLELVARDVEFAENAVPDARLPALALLARVDSQAVGADLVAAFQTAVSLVNVDRAQKAQPSLRLELAAQAGTTITSARFAPPEPGTGVDLRYNLEPACALVGDTFVVGTHRALVAELAGELARPVAQARVSSEERLRLSGAALCALAREQRELLVLGRVLSDGVEMDTAEAQIDSLIEALAAVEGFELRTARAGDDALEAVLALDLRATGTMR